MSKRSKNVIVGAVAAAVALAVVIVVAVVSGLPGSSGGPADGTSAGAGAGASSAADAPEGATVVAFYGDSYTLGTGASDPSKRWSTIVSAERDWFEVNPSVNGLGFVNNRASLPPDYRPSDEVPQVIAAEPDILFITMGLNDNFSMPERAEAIEAAISTDFETLHDALPDTRIIVVEPFWYTDDRPESLGEIIGWVKSAAAEIDADYIPDASHWIEGHPEWMAADGLHPNDEGYAAMAERMNAALGRLGL